MQIPIKILMDLGNARVKWATWSDGEIHPGDPVRLERGWERSLEAAWTDLSRPAAVLAANVAGKDAAWILDRLCWRLWRMAPEFVAVRNPFLGLRTAYRDPARLGVDRWLALLAAWRSGLAPCLVVDAGSALTLDPLLADGRHPGGFILPGPRQMRTCLLAGTQISDPGPGSDAEPLPRDTASAIRVGVQAAALGAIDRARRHLPSAAGILLTGGDTGDLIRSLGTVALRPHLVLEGVAVLARSVSGSGP